MSDLRLDGKDSIVRFGFLTHLVTEADILEMKERQAFIALPHLLSSSDLYSYHSICGSFTQMMAG